MTKIQLLKSLHILNKQLTACATRMGKISKSLGVDENEDIKKVINEVQELIKLGEEHVHST